MTGLNGNKFGICTINELKHYNELGRAPHIQIEVNGAAVYAGAVLSRTTAMQVALSTNEAQAVLAKSRKVIFFANSLRVSQAMGVLHYQCNEAGHLECVKLKHGRDVLFSYSTQDGSICRMLSYLVRKAWLADLGGVILKL